MTLNFKVKGQGQHKWTYFGQFKYVSKYKTIWCHKWHCLLMKNMFKRWWTNGSKWTSTYIKWKSLCTCTVYNPLLHPICQADLRCMFPIRYSVPLHVNSEVQACLGIWHDNNQQAITMKVGKRDLKNNNKTKN